MKNFLSVLVAAFKSPTTYAALGAFLGSLTQLFPHATQLAVAATGISAAAATGNATQAILATATAALAGISVAGHALKSNSIANGANGDK